MRRIPVIAFLLTMGVVGTRAADDPPPGPEDQQQTADRGVARISLINGEISVRRGDSGDVTAAVINAPLMAQDSLLTSSSSRAELQFDSANMLRIGSNSEVRIGDLQYHRYQAQIALGTVTFRILRDSDAQTELDTPVVGVRPLRRGVYRITVREDGNVEITVREGEAEIVSQHGSERLQAGSTMLARGSVQDPEFQIVAHIGPDEWDHWNAGRDREFLQSRSHQYVSPDIEGAEELDAHGRWVNDPTYGNVWAPTVDSGWAPYRVGRWVYEPYYGWTWLSGDPWGWAPYHYGRWFYGPVGWCWSPGALYGRHYWSPALVAFVGFGGYGGVHVGFGFGFGSLGWIPLGPHEPFNRWWGGGRTTIVNNINVTNVYRNARVSNGITAVNASNFGRGGGQYTAMSGHGLQNASLVRGGLGVTPDRSSMRFSDRQVNRSAFPQSRGSQFYGSGTQRGFSSTVGSQPGRTAGSFSGRGWQTTGGGGSSTVGTVRGSQASPGASSRSGWQGFGNNSRGSSNTPASTYQQQPNSGSRGWQSSGTQGGSPTGSRGWQGYGSTGNNPAGTSSRGASGSGGYQPSQSSGASRGWQSYGGSSTQSATPTRTQSYSSGGWNRGNSQPQSYQSRGTSGSPVRISPPIVRSSGGSGNSHSTSSGGSSRGSSGGGSRGSSGGGHSRR